TKIYSPIDGVIIARKVDVGQTVAASLSAPELFTIAQDLRKMQVIASINEADVGALKEGLKATFTVDAYPGEDFAGAITQLRLDPTTTNGVVTYDAVIGVDNEAQKLRPGMTANASIVSVRREDALLVQNAALRFAPTQGTGRGARSPSATPQKPAPGTTRG